MDIELLYSAVIEMTVHKGLTKIRILINTKMRKCKKKNQIYSDLLFIQTVL